MTLTYEDKQKLKQELVRCLKDEKEILKIVVFGSFIESGQPNDMDVAVFQDSKQSYLPLALKYRQRIRSLSRRIPVDIIPIQSGADTGYFLPEVSRGEVIYER